MSWPLATLANLCEINMGKTPSRHNAAYWGEGHPWLSIADMNQGLQIFETKESITQEAVKECNCKPVESGTVLLSFKLSIGKVGIANRRLFTNEAIAALPVKNPNQLDATYLSHALRAIDFTDGLDRAAKGLTLNKDKLARIKLPLPPLPEQRRIAAILDQADALRAKRREALAQLDSLTQSIFIEIFGDQRPNILDGDVVKLADLVEINPRIYQEERQMLRDTEVAFLPMASVSDIDRRVIANELRPYEEVAKGYTSFKRGDLLVAKITPCYENGKMAITDELPTEHGFGSTEFHVFRPPTAQIGLFTFYFLQQDWVSEAGAKSMKGAAGQKRVPADFFASLKVRTPLASELEKFAGSISKIEGLKKLARLSGAEHEALFSSLQHRAFRGEL